MVPYKRVELIAEAFSAMPDKRLIVVGEGPEFEKVRVFSGDNVELVGYREPAALVDLMQRAKAFVFAAEEDFGIAPVEAQACGTPVIAYGKGGASETVIDGVTGILFESQTCDSIRQAVDRFETGRGRFKPSTIRRYAERFSKERFRREFGRIVETAMTSQRRGDASLHRQSITIGRRAESVQELVRKFVETGGAY